MDFPLYSKTWQANEKREEKESSKSTMNLGFQLFILLRKVQRAETNPSLFKPEGSLCSRIFSMVFLDRKRDISSFLSPRIHCCILSARGCLFAYN